MERNTTIGRLLGVVDVFIVHKVYTLPTLPHSLMGIVYFLSPDFELGQETHSRILVDVTYAISKQLFKWV